MTHHNEGEAVNHHPKKVIVITQFWAGIVASVMTAAFIGAFAFAWNANAQISVMRDYLGDVKKANLDNRLSVIEAKLDFIINRTTQRR